MDLKDMTDVTKLCILLQRYEETMGFIRDICFDYKDKPSVGLLAIQALAKDSKLKWKKKGGEHE